MPEAKAGMVNSGRQPNTMLPKDVQGGLMGVLLLASCQRGGKDRVLGILERGILQDSGPFPSLPSLPLRPKKNFSSLLDSPGSLRMTSVSEDGVSG